MQDALPIVIVAVVIVAGVVAIATLVLSRGSYDQIGRSDMTFDREVAADPFRDEEIRQLLEATNARRAAHGRPPLDLDVARRARRTTSCEPRSAPSWNPATRAGSPAGSQPLDVEAEVERRLSGQDG